MNALWAAVGDHARPNSATHAADPRQRGIGFAIGGKADMSFCTAYVR
jgi:hypothetical protein